MNVLPPRRLDAERFAVFVVAGGLALVAGLWIVEGFPAESLAWLSGVCLAALGTAGLVAGIRRGLDQG